MAVRPLAHFFGLACLVGLLCFFSDVARAQTTITVDTTINASTLTVSGDGMLTIDGAISPVLSLINTATTSGITSLNLGDTNQGVLQILSGSSLSNSSSGLMGVSVGSTGTATISGSGSSWTNSTGLIVGHSGSGTLNILDGGHVTSSYGYLGSVSGGIGVATVSGSGSTWTTAGSLAVGFSGTGSLSVFDGGLVHSGEGNLGYSLGSGTVTVSGGDSLWSVVNNLNVGFNGTGTLSVLAGGAMTNDHAFVGLTSSSTGTVTVSGTGSTWTNSGDLHVGESGTGSLSVLAGGLVTNRNGNLGYFSTASGTATVSGTDSTWNNSDQLSVGNSGTGSLSILAGGQVTNTVGLLGLNTTGVGTVTVSGAGSAWTNSADLIIGGGGNAGLSVLDSGTVHNVDGYLGYDSGASGTVTVSGAGSTWSNSGSLYVGGSDTDPGGTGAITVTDSGLLSVGDTLKLWATGTLTLGGGNISAQSFDRSAGTFNFNDGTLTIDGGVYTQASGNLVVNGVTATSSPMLILANGATVSGNTNAIIGGYGQGSLQILSGSTLGNGDYSMTIGTLSGAIGTVTVSGAGSSLNYGGITVGNAGSGTLAVFDGGQVESGIVAYLGKNATATGNVIVSGTNSSLTIGFTFLGYSGTGSLSILDGGTVHSLYDVEVGSNPGSLGTITVSGAGSTWNVGNVDDYFFVGYTGQGTLNILDGGAVHNYDATLGRSGVNSSALVSGTDSVWTSTGSLSIGDFGGGQAALTVADGGLVTVDDTLYLFASSMLTIDGGSVVAHDFERRLSSTLNFMDGHLTIDGGTYTEQTDPRLVINGATATSSPVFSMFNNATTSGVRTLVVGSSNLGTLFIESGSTLSNSGSGGAGSVAGVNINDGFNYIGLAEGSIGTATVSGGTWTTSGSTYVGYQGTGALTITNGGNLSNGSSSIVGVADTGVGTVTVSGAGSTWTDSFDLTLGSAGSGTLHVLDGGVVSDKNGFLGRFTASSSGTATVSGAGSIWSNSGSLYVGGSSTASVGTGILTVADSGLVSVGGTIKVWETGTLNLSGGTIQADTLDITVGTFNFNGGTLDIANGITATAGYTLNVADNTLINNGTITNTVNVGSGGTVGGSGTFTTLHLDGGTVAPGNSPGTITSGTTIIDSGTYQWQINALATDAGLPGSNPGWDLWDAGAVTIGGPITIELQSLTIGNFEGSLASWDYEHDYQWLIATSSNHAFQIATISGWTVDWTSQFDDFNLVTGTFNLSEELDGTELYLNYSGAPSAVPEPSTLLLASIGAAGFAAYRRKRKAGLPPGAKA